MSDGTPGAGLNEEYTLGANWFFNGHRNKLTLDVSYLAIDDSLEDESDVRLRLQWDVSI
jgi:phosphate-selective porin OprO/OprP